NEISLARRPALKRALPEKILHKRADVQPDLRPERFVVRLEDGPLRAAIQTLFDVEREPTDRHILVFVRELVCAAQCACAPDDAPVDGKEAQAVDAERIEQAVFAVG